MSKPGTGIALRTASPGSTATCGEDLVCAFNQVRTEVLSIRDLACTDLSHLRQVVLSACWSADNFVLPGRRVVSLPETLCRAGARSVLGSLWPVDDAIAVALMGRFYDYLETHPRDEALRRAQLDCLQGRLFGGPDAYATHPVAWAGFTLSGDAGRLGF